MSLLIVFFLYLPVIGLYNHFCWWESVILIAYQLLEGYNYHET